MTTKITEKNISKLANVGVNGNQYLQADGSTGLTAVAGRGYFINTTSATVTVTLPASPSAGDTIVQLKITLELGATKMLTFNRNGNYRRCRKHLLFQQMANCNFSLYGSTKGWLFTNEDTTCQI
jgi:hypothetical protein